MAGRIYHIRARDACMQKIFVVYGTALIREGTEFDICSTTRISPYIIFQNMLADQSQRDWAISQIVMSGVTLPLSIPSPPQFEDPDVPNPTISVRADIA
jgi:hypothetical protein